MNKKSIVIIGAGPAGLSAAYELSKYNFKVHVIESSPHIGGLCRSLDLWGQTMDLGPHRFFSQNDEVNNFWHEVIDTDFTVVNRLTRIFYRDHFFYYPLQLVDTITKLGLPDIFRCVLSYGISAVTPFKPKTFEDWVVGRFGRRLFDIFFKTYSEKVWGIPCSRLDADWAAQRIRNFSLIESVKAGFSKKSARKHKTLADEFFYPNKGTGNFYEKLSQLASNNGATIELNTTVNKIITDSDGIDSPRVSGILLEDGRELPADYIISTMPLPEMVKGLDAVPASVTASCNDLRFRNTILVYLELDQTDIFPDNWIYVHAPEVQHGRITNSRNWSALLYDNKDTTILCIEYWCFDTDSLWRNSDESISHMAEKELRSINLVTEGTKCINSFILKLPKTYPVYELGYKAHLENINHFLSAIDNLYSIGRNGSFRYNNQDHSIMMGLLTARQIVTGKSQDFSAVNTASEYLEA